MFIKVTEKKIAWGKPVLAVLITLSVYSFVMLCYLQGPLQGNFNHFFMPAEMFGIPAQLKAHGITELYQGSIQTGWDGQFYYYIANDPLSLKDTVQHIDSNAYRYQRIGLPLLAYLVSKLTLQSWVSPLTYYLSSLFVILFAVGRAAFFFQKRNLSPYVILFWALSCGPLVTQLNGLPDAAADGFLIIGLVSLIDRTSWRDTVIAIVGMTFAALSREVYILIPLFIACFLVLENIRFGGSKAFFLFKNMTNLLGKLYLYNIPILVAGIWQVFIRMKFGVSPSSQASGVLSWPLLSAWHYMQAGFLGNTGRIAHLESFGIFLFLLLLLLNIVVSGRFLLQTRLPIHRGIAAAFLSITLMYFCFGNTLMKDYTGYFKAVSVYLFVIPFVIVLQQKKMTVFMRIFLASLMLYFDAFLWGRINAAPPSESEPEVHYATSPPVCLKDYHAKLELVSSKNLSEGNLLKRFLLDRRSLMQIKITNLSPDTFVPFQGQGGVNLSYQWVRMNNGAFVKDGIRTSLPDILAPYQSVILPIKVNFPRILGHYELKLSLVQEGCAWFYLVQPDSAFTMPYTVGLW